MFKKPGCRKEIPDPYTNKDENDTGFFIKTLGNTESSKILLCWEKTKQPRILCPVKLKKKTYILRFYENTKTDQKYIFRIPILQYRSKKVLQRE